jgi:hypothetical protein
MVLISLVFGAIVALAVLLIIGNRNAKLAARLDTLEQRKEAARLLGDALRYLSCEGPGHNLEWTNARCIIENALLEVLYK